MPRITIAEVRAMKGKEKVPMLTAYDYTTAKLLDEAGVPLILVGDSLGMVMLGYESTIPVTMEEMLHHTRAVVRGSKRAMVIGDMPFMTYHISVAEALRNAARFIQEGGAQAVKLEGGEMMAETVHRLVSCGIPVMGHIGLTPQSALQIGLKAQGRTPEEALRLVKDALALEQAGAFAIVLESVPFALAEFITQKVAIPTIGIGAGPGTDGQVQVIHDMLGSYTDFVPRHAKQYVKLADLIRKAVSEYTQEVKAGTFPTEAHSYKIDPQVLEEGKKRT
ncbi:MAG TPA: 3-methyl-2-oxobutanoate hydroxymethyltransferase [Dehalococcoidia bacterium]|nr:3-methyl-2-oxobutanoate hydroxymethyltransferase [Dehalococcoidia bacterium]